MQNVSIISFTSFCRCKSNPCIGSSRISSSGSFTKARANRTILCSPLEISIKERANNANALSYKNLGKAMKAAVPPHVMAAMALAALVVGIYEYKKAQIDADKAHRMTAESMGEYNDRLKEEQTETRSTINAIQNKTNSLLEQVKAYQKLIKEHDIFKGFSREEVAGMSSEQVDALLYEEQKNKVSDAYQSQLNALSEINNKQKLGDFITDNDIEEIAKKHNVPKEVWERWTQEVGWMTGINEWVKNQTDDILKTLEESRNEGISSTFNIEVFGDLKDDKLKSDIVSSLYVINEAVKNSGTYIADRAKEEYEANKKSIAAYNKYKDAMADRERLDKDYADKMDAVFVPKINAAYEKWKSLNAQMAKAPESKKMDLKIKVDYAKTELEVYRSLLDAATNSKNNPSVTIEVKTKLEEATLGDETLVEISEEYKKINDVAAGYLDRINSIKDGTVKLKDGTISDTNDISKAWFDLGNEVEDDFKAREDALEREISDLEGRKDDLTDPEHAKIPLLITEKKQQLDYLRNLKNQITGLTKTPYNIMFSLGAIIPKKIKDILNLIGIDIESVIKRGEEASTRIEEKKKKDDGKKSRKEWDAEDKKAMKKRVAEYKRFLSGKGFSDGENKIDFSHMSREEYDKYKENNKDVEAYIKKGEAGVREARQRRQKQYDLDLKQKEENEKQRRAMDAANEKARIAAIVDENEREREEHDYQFRQTMQQLDEKEEAYRKKNLDTYKSEWSNKKENKNKIWADTKEAKEVLANGYGSVALTDEQAKEIEADRQEALAKERVYQNGIYENQLKSLRNYLKEYGDFEAKKLAITKEYEEQIEDALADHDYAKAEGLREKSSQEVSEARMQEIKDSMDWEGLFNNLDRYSSEYLESIHTRLSEMMKDPNLQATDRKVIAEKMDEVETKRNEKRENTFAWVNDYLAEQIRLEKELARAKEEYINAADEQAQAEKDLLQQQIDVAALLDELGGEGTAESLFGDLTEISSNNIDLSATIDSMKLTEEQAKRLREAFAKLSGEEVKAAAATGKATKKLGEQNNAQEAANVPWKEQVSGALKSFNEDVRKYIGDLPELLEEIGFGEAGEKVQKGLDGINDAAGAAEDYAKGNYVGAALKGIKAVKNFGSALGIGGGNAAETQKQIERLTEKNEQLIQAMDRLRNTMSNMNGVELAKAYERLIDYQKDVQKNQLDIAKKQAGYHSAHHSFNYYWDGFSQEQKAKYGQQMGLNGWNGDIWSLTPEQMNTLLSNSEVREQIRNTGKASYGEAVLKELDAYADEAYKVKEITRQVVDQLTHISFDSMYDNFVNKLMDMKAKAKDFSTDIESYVREGLYKAQSDEKIKPKLEDWQKAWAYLANDEDGLTDAERHALMHTGGSYVDQEKGERKTFDSLDSIETAALAIRDNVENFGWEYQKNKDQQSATYNSAQNITYEQADGIWGTLINHTMLMEQGNADRSVLSMKLSDMAAIQERSYNVHMENRDILAGMAIHVEQIRDDVAEIVKFAKANRSDIAKITDNVKQML